MVNNSNDLTPCSYDVMVNKSNDVISNNSNDLTPCSYDVISNNSNDLTRYNDDVFLTN